MTFPESEMPHREKLIKHFEEWTAALRGKFQETADCTVDGFVTDGFAPFYFSRKVRILFVGRECRDLSGHDYIAVIHRAFREDKLIGDRSLNLSKFHRLMLYIAFSLNNNYATWEETPTAIDIGADFATEDGVSFAFMNLSKFSNDTTSWQLQAEQVGRSLAASCGERNFIREEVALLAPHIVVSMNLGDRIDLLADQIEWIETDQAASVGAYRIKLNGRTSLLLDTFHFSAPTKGDRACYFDPVREAVQKHAALWN